MQNTCTKMANEQLRANEVILHAAAEAARATIQATAATRAERIQNVGPRLGGTKMKQPAFNWEAEDKYNELKTSKENYYKTTTNTIRRTDSNHKKWLGRKGLQFLETLTQTEQEKCNTTEGLFKTLKNKFQPKDNETIKSLQF